jgi:MoaA/NifB/PqqE/SkfB family radical SAM enzyme
VYIGSVQRFIPARVKFFLKPYYRKLFSHRLHVVFWPTFRCNYSCTYCTVGTKFDFTTVFPRSSERQVDQWIVALEKLPPAMIYISGGEPFVYAGLPELVNRLPKKHQLLGIVSNVSLPASVYRKIKYPFHLNASFHREFVSAENFIARVKELQEFLHVHVNIVATPENLSMISSIDGLMATHRISLHVDPYVDREFRYSASEQTLLRKYTQADRKSLVDFSDFSPKQCSAGRNYINLLPDGQVFTCAAGFSYTYSPLYTELVGNQPLENFRMGNIFDSNFRLHASDIVCKLPCKDACDRDSVLVAVQSAEGSFQTT